MTDIVERLREITPDVTGKSYFWGKQVKEAADEIERLRLELSATHDMAATLEADVLRLRAERDALRAALQEIAALPSLEEFPHTYQRVTEIVDAALAARGKDE